MSVNITWSTTQSGDAVAETLTGSGAGVNHGNGNAGDIYTARSLWIRHDGTNPIVGCGFYLGQFSGTYAGHANPSADLLELLEWGDGVTAASFGGFAINMYAPDFMIAWSALSHSAKGSIGDTVVACRTNVGDNAINKLPLKTTMGAAIISDGVMAGNGATDANFQCRIAVPSEETTVGVRQFNQVLRYTYTS